MNKICSPEETIENIYRVFGTYSLRRGYPIPCPCGCISKEDVLRLHSKPLRQLTATDLNRYTWKAMTTWGDVEDFKYYLPRMLDLMLTHQWNDVSSDPMVKLVYGQWRTWAAEEQAVIESFMWTLWDCALGGQFDVWNTFVTIGTAVENVSPYLQYWQDRCAIDEKALVALADVAITLWFQGSFHVLQQSQYDQTRGWILSPTVRTTLETAFFEYSGRESVDQTLVQLFSDAIDRLDWLREQASQ